MEGDGTGSPAVLLQRMSFQRFAASSLLQLNREMKFLQSE